MPRKSNVLCSLVALALACTATDASAQRLERWADAKPYGLFFNDDAPNFYTGFMPRVQERNRIKIHLVRGNQLRVRMVLPDSTIDNYLTDQLAKHDLYAEVIDSGKIVLAANTASLVPIPHSLSEQPVPGFVGIAARWRKLHQ
jgi:hypothetical protein